MSHFSVIVATKDYPTNEILSETLQPFHEFECTGVDDCFVQDVDVTGDYARLFAEWGEDSYKSLLEFVEADGKKLVKSGDHPDLVGEHKYGYCVMDSNGILKVIDRTNPDRKWDYWRVGGRYCRKFIPKPGRKGRTEPLSWEWKDQEREAPDGVDVIRKGDLDIQAMRYAREQDRRDLVADVVAKTGLSFEEVCRGIEEHSESCKGWRDLPEPRPRGEEFQAWLAERSELASKVDRGCCSVPDTNGLTVQEWIASAPYLTSFAFIRKGKWEEKGSMGWFACVSNEKEDWPDQFLSLIDNVPDDWYLTVVDCHI